MLKGIDISMWQGDIDLSPMPIDFVITKATEADYYVDPYCDKNVQQAKRLGLKWGFYHYVKPEINHLAQAKFFLTNTINYFGEGIPCLDWEGNGSPNDYYGTNGINEMAKYIYEHTGVWPWIYSWPGWFDYGGVEPNCGRWIASYPNVLRPGLDYELPDVPETDGLVACWQYASDGDVNGYNGYLDVDRFFGDKVAWDLYANPQMITPDIPKDETPSAVSVLENEKYKVTIEEK